MDKKYEYICGGCGHRHYWCAITSFVLCSRCSSRNVRRRGDDFTLRYRPLEDRLYSAIVFARGRIRAGRRQRAIWQKTEEGLFLTCPGCAAIIDASRESISLQGNIEGCVVCPMCEAHAFVYLEGWKQD